MARQFYSTNSPGSFVDLKEAVLRSLPADNGLYMPEEIPVLGAEFWESWRDWSFEELGFNIVKPLLDGAVPEEVLREMVAGAINFDAPIVKLNEQEYVLELFHGPTLAFKDFGARFMARLMGWLTRDDDRELTVLVATSGDTGGAVASAFHGVAGRLSADGEVGVFGSEDVGGAEFDLGELDQHRAVDSSDVLLFPCGAAVDGGCGACVCGAERELWQPDGGVVGREDGFEGEEVQRADVSQRRGAGVFGDG